MSHETPDEELAEAEQFSVEELLNAIDNRDRELLDRYLASKHVITEVRAFLKRSKPNREKTTTKGKADRDLWYARAKSHYTERMALHGEVKRARAEMLEKFPMHEETAVRITEGDLTHINRISAAISNPVISK